MSDSASAGAPDPSAERRRHMRVAISTAALQLATERGLATVTVDEIARAANISRRTFFNYFPSKAAAVIPFSIRLEASSIDALLTDFSRSTMQSVALFLWTNILHVESQNPEAFARWHTVLRTDPELQPEVHRLLDQLEQRVASFVTQRLANERNQHEVRKATLSTSMEGAAISSAAVATFRVAIDQWQVGEAPDALRDRINEAFEALHHSCMPPRISTT